MKRAPWYDFSLSGEWRNWQTRRTQNPVGIALVGVRLPPRPPRDVQPKDSAPPPPAITHFVGFGSRLHRYSVLGCACGR